MKIQDYCDTVNGALRLKLPLQTFTRGTVVTDDPVMLSQLDLLDRVGQGCVPLTIRGEQGSGKDRVAQYAHEVSTRRKVPLVKINCTYLSADQLYLKLFGPASNRDLGLLSRAAGGSLYMENADLMDLDLQYQLMNHIKATSSLETGNCFTQD